MYFRTNLVGTLPSAARAARRGPRAPGSRVGPAEGAYLAPPHPRHEEEPRDHRVDAAAGGLIGLDAAPASTRAMAGGEDGGQVCRPERPRLPTAAAGPPVAGEDPGGAFPGRARLPGEAGPTPGSKARPSPRPKLSEWSAALPATFSTHPAARATARHRPALPAQQYSRTSRRPSFYTSCSYPPVAVSIASFSNANVSSALGPLSAEPKIGHF